MKPGHAGAAGNMSTAYDLEGFTSSTLRSKGCGAGVGVEEVCPALATVPKASALVYLTIFAVVNHRDLGSDLRTPGEE
jgi:hypothetical protein